VPKGINSSCCGMMFSSRGFAPAAATKMAELEKSLLDASEGGKLPIVCDTSPCLFQIKTSLSTPALRFALYEPVEFINHFLVDKLEWKKVWSNAAQSSSPRAITDFPLDFGFEPIDRCRLVPQTVQPWCGAFFCAPGRLA
jgi:hypothetical protein